MDSSSTPNNGQAIPLERWLRELQAAASPPFLLGATGHLILTPAEERRVAEQLDRLVLPQVLRLAGARELLVLTGLAPGADHLFSRITLEHLRRQRLSCRLVGLLPLPLAAMLDDWAEKARTQPGFSGDVYERQRRLMQQEIEACDQVVHLIPPGTTPESVGREVFRQLQYRRLAACLAEQADALVAILRGGSTAQPGGTAEVVNWRRQPARVPANITTLPLRHTVAAPGGPLFVIAPDAESGND